MFRLKQVSFYIESAVGIRGTDVGSGRPEDRMAKETVIRFARPV